MYRTAFIRWMVVLSLTLTLTGCGVRRPAFRGTELNPPQSAPDFTLIDQHGRPFRLSDQRGKVVLLFFGYTHCPDVCPTTLATWGQVYDALGDDAKRVRFVFITVDPERDTPERLQQHLAAFNPEFIGLTGSLDQLEAIYRAFYVYREKAQGSQSAVGYLVNHTAGTFLIDPEGRWRLRYGFGTPPEDIVEDIRTLLGR